MSDRKPLLQNLEDTGWLDDETIEYLKNRLRQKLKKEEQTQKKEMKKLQNEVVSLKRKLIG